MAQFYPRYYVLENSIRVVIMLVLEKKYGKEWWMDRPYTCTAISQGIEKQKENKQALGMVSVADMRSLYSDFSDLKKIIIMNWDDFKCIFPSQAWISQKLEEN